MEPWRYYLDRLEEKVGELPPETLGRTELIADAAHDAYQATADRLTAEGWDDEHVLTITRLFGQAVQDWLHSGSQDWGALAGHTRDLYERWAAEGRTEG